MNRNYKIGWQIIDEARYDKFNPGEPVLPLRGYVKGNTLEKQVASAVEFFSVASDSGKNGGLVISMDGKMAIIFTSGSGKSQYQHAIKKDAYKRWLRHDQNFRRIGDYKPIGYFEYDESGITDSFPAAVNPNMKITKSFTYK